MRIDIVHYLSILPDFSLAAEVTVKCNCGYTMKLKVTEGSILTCPKCGRKAKVMGEVRFWLEGVDREVVVNEC